MQKVTVTVGDEVFSFSSFDDWCDSAKYKFELSGLRGRDTICIDAQGRICLQGKEFMRARDDGSFPIQVFKILLD